jgi:hypothetical protein
MDNNNELEDLRAAIGQKLESARALVSKLERAYHDLLPVPPTKPYASGKYAGKLVWLAVRDYLQESGPSSVTDIIDELQREGVDLGKYPRRTIKSSIGSHYLKGFFRVEKGPNDEVIFLADEAKGDSSALVVRQPKRKAPARRR